MPTLTDDEKKQQIAAILKEELLKRVMKHGPMYPNIRFAQELGIGASDMSRYLNGEILPGFRNAFMMSKVVPQIAVIMNLGDVLPSDPFLRWMFTHWHQLEEEQQARFLQVAEEFSKKKPKGK